MFFLQHALFCHVYHRGRRIRVFINSTSRKDTVNQRLYNVQQIKGHKIRLEGLKLISLPI